MERRLTRRVIAVGLALVLLGVVVPGFHHVRCGGTVSIAPDGSARNEALGCEETFPVALAFAAAGVGIVASLVVLTIGFSLARADDAAGPRALVGLAAITLGIPALIMLVSWGSAGFDLRFQEPGGGCTATSPWARPPFWLQHTMCVDPYDVVRVPLLALSGIAAAFGALRVDHRIMLVGLIAGAGAVAAIVMALVDRTTTWGLVWTLPVLGTLVLALGAWLARRQARGQPETAAA